MFDQMDTSNKIMITCKESTFLISKKQQDKLTLGEKVKLQFHLMMCKYCRRFDAQISFIQKAILRLRKKIEQQSTDITLSQAQKEKIKEALKNQKK